MALRALRARGWGPAWSAWAQASDADGLQPMAWGVRGARGAASGQRAPQAQAVPPAHGAGTSRCATVIEDTDHPIRDAHVPPAVWACMSRLRGAGHDVFVVGGTVRDLLLGRAPKDVDLLTSADLGQVTKLFPGRATKVGRRFPIALLRLDGGPVVEIASMHTAAPARSGSLGGGGTRPIGSLLRDRRGAARGDGHAMHWRGRQPEGQQATWAQARRSDALARDFTVNALLYDPFSRLLYDYVGGVGDVSRRTLRTVGEPHASLSADPVRILRAVRCAARAGLSLDPGLSAALRRLGPRMAGLPAIRLKLEVAALLSYGAAAPSVRLLQQHDLLRWLLPLHAAQLEERADEGSSAGALLWQLLELKDRHAGTSRPASQEACLALLAVPLLLQQLQEAAQLVEAGLAERQAASGAGGAQQEQQATRRAPDQQQPDTQRAVDASAEAGTPSEAGMAGAGDEAPAAAPWLPVRASGARSPGAAAAAKAVLRGKQSLEAIIRQLSLGAVHQVARASVPGRPGVNVLAERRASLAAGLLVEHWLLCAQRSGTAGARSMAQQQLPAPRWAARSTEWRERPGPCAQPDVTLDAARGHAADHLHDQLYASGTQSGIVWLRPPGQQVVAGGHAGRGFHSGGGMPAAAEPCLDDDEPFEARHGASGRPDTLVHEVLTAAGVRLQHLAGLHATAVRLRQQRVQQSSGGASSSPPAAAATAG